MENLTNDTSWYDALVNVAVTNLYSIGRKEKEINFYNFKWCASDLCVLHIAEIVNGIFGYKITLNCPLFQFVRLKMAMRHSKWLKFSRKKGTDVNVFFTAIEQANDDVGVFEKIYKEYYEDNN